jgi:FkbM family methyltransferase
MRLPRPLRLAIKRLAYGGLGRGRDGARVIDWLAPRPGMVVADIGSGFGDFAFRFAEAVAPGGRVYCVDTDLDLLDVIAHRAAESGLHDVRVIHAAPDRDGLPEPVDLAFFSASFHHLPDRQAYIAALRAHLQPGARVAILETRPTRWTSLMGGHATAPSEVRRILTAAGYRPVASADFVRFSTIQTFEVEAD